MSYPVESERGDLTESHLKSLLEYSPETGAFWYIRDSGNVKAGTVVNLITAHGYRSVMINYKWYPLHRLAWLWMTGSFPAKGLQIDHRNGIKTDNRWCNLRLSSPSQNQQNAKKPTHNSTGVKGVLLIQGRGNRRPAYEARIEKEGKHYCRSKSFDPSSEVSKQLALGYVTTWLQTKRAEIHGEFANHG